MPYKTTLVGDDTDLLVLLCFHVKEDSCEVFFKPEIRSGTKKSPRCWNIKYVQMVLGRVVCNNLLFAHAILGCDTTSRVFSTGKGHALKHIRSDNHYITKAEIFLQESATLADISSAGEAALVCLYTFHNRGASITILNNSIASRIAITSLSRVYAYSHRLQYHELQMSISIYTSEP